MSASFWVISLDFGAFRSGIAKIPKLVSAIIIHTNRVPFVANKLYLLKINGIIIRTPQELAERFNAIFDSIVRYIFNTRGLLTIALMQISFTFWIICHRSSIDTFAPLLAGVNIFVLRHGEAGSHTTMPSKDLERPLTESGREDIESIAISLHKLRVGFDRIATSPLKRAKETAEIVAKVYEESSPKLEIWEEASTRRK